MGRVMADILGSVSHNVRDFVESHRNGVSMEQYIPVFNCCRNSVMNTKFWSK